MMPKSLPNTPSNVKFLIPQMSNMRLSASVYAANLRGLKNRIAEFYGTVDPKTIGSWIWYLEEIEKSLEDLKDEIRSFEDLISMMKTNI